MLPRRLIVVAAILLVAGMCEATAQFGGFPPQPQANPCQGFVSIRDDAQKTIAALSAAQQRKAPREEFCQLFQRLSGATGKMVKFLETNKQLCNVPNDAIAGAKSEHGKATNLRKQACATGSPSAGPSLSDVLGAPVMPESSTTKPDTGTFNTLTGNPLTR